MLVIPTTKSTWFSDDIAMDMTLPFTDKHGYDLKICQDVDFYHFKILDKIFE